MQEGCRLLGDGGVGRSGGKGAVEKFFTWWTIEWEMISRPLGRSNTNVRANEPTGILLGQQERACDWLIVKRLLFAEGGNDCCGSLAPAECCAVLLQA